MEKDAVKNNSRLIKGIIAGLTLVAILATTLVLYHYFQTFPDDATKDHATWGQIGDFFGGILNPIYGFVGFIALLSTIILQSQELEATRKEMSESSDALKKQAAHMENEAKKAELYKMIESVFNEISKMMPIQISMTINQQQVFVQIAEVFYIGNNNQHEALKDAFCNKKDEKHPFTLHKIETFSMLFSELGKYLGDYKRISKNNTSLMYFSLRTQYPARILHDKGYLDKVYLDAIEIGQTLTVS